METIGKFKPQVLNPKLLRRCTSQGSLRKPCTPVQASFTPTPRKVVEARAANVLPYTVTRTYVNSGSRNTTPETAGNASHVQKQCSCRGTVLARKQSRKHDSLNACSETQSTSRRTSEPQCQQHKFVSGKKMLDRVRQCTCRRLAGKQNGSKTGNTTRNNARCTTSLICH